MIFFQFTITDADKRLVRRAFSHYVDPELLSGLLHEPAPTAAQSASESHSTWQTSSHEGQAEKHFMMSPILFSDGGLWGYSVVLVA